MLDGSDATQRDFDRHMILSLQPEGNVNTSFSARHFNFRFYGLTIISSSISHKKEKYKSKDCQSYLYIYQIYWIMTPCLKIRKYDSPCVERFSYNIRVYRWWEGPLLSLYMQSYKLIDPVWGFLFDIMILFKMYQTASLVSLKTSSTRIMHLDVVIITCYC